MAEKAKEQASQLGEAAFSGAGNIAAATGLVKKEEFPADLKVRPPHSGCCRAGGDPGGPLLLCLCLGRAGIAAPSVLAADVCVHGLPHGGWQRGAGSASLQRLRGDLTAAGAEGWGGAVGSHLATPMSPLASSLAQNSIC